MAYFILHFSHDYTKQLTIARSEAFHRQISRAIDQPDPNKVPNIGAQHRSVLVQWHSGNHSGFHWHQLIRPFSSKNLKMSSLQIGNCLFNSSFCGIPIEFAQLANRLRSNENWRVQMPISPLLNKKKIKI